MKVVRAPFDGVCSTDIWVVSSTNGIDQGFLYYWMASQEFVDFSMQGSEGTKMPRAKWNHVSRHKVPFFTEDEQKAIAHILGSLDDKIELNRRMNETLEAMAQALFKSRFVDFDPVIDKALAARNEIPEELTAKSEVRREQLEEQYGSLEAAANSSHFKLHHSNFPSEFIQTEEMGWIPKGWSIGKIYDLGEVICGKTPPTNEPENYGTEIPFITIPDMHSTVYITHTGKTLSRKGADTQTRSIYLQTQYV